MAEQRTKLAPPGMRNLGITPPVGSTEHVMLMLVLVEVAALVLIRRYFSSAHGG